MRWWGLGLLTGTLACSGGAGGGASNTDGPAYADSEATLSSVGSGASGGPTAGVTSGTGGTATEAGPGPTASASEDGTAGSEDSGALGPRCSDGVVDSGEQCDDGNDIDGDGCNRDCRFSGQLEWQQTYGAGVGGIDQAFAVAPEQDGSVMVGGYVSDDADLRDAWLGRFGPDGTLLWQVSIAGPGGGNDEVRALVSDGEGTVYAAGYQNGPEGQGHDAWFAQYDLDGNEQLITVYNGPDSGHDVFQTMAGDADGNLVLGGYSHSADEGNDVFLRKVTPSGAVLWSRTFPGPNGGTDVVWDLEVSSAGHIYASGYQEGPAGEGRNAWLGKFDTDGNEIWQRSFNGPDSRDDLLIGLAIVGVDDVVVSGYLGATGYPWQAIVRRYDSLGMIVWSNLYEGATTEGAHAFGLETDGDGSLVMVGGEIQGGVRSVLVRKFDPEGNERWTTVVPGGASGPDYARELKILEDGRVWVVGALDSGVDARDVWVGRFTP